MVIDSSSSSTTSQHQQAIKIQRLSSIRHLETIATILARKAVSELQTQTVMNRSVPLLPEMDTTHVTAEIAPRAQDATETLSPLLPPNPHPYPNPNPLASHPPPQLVTQTSHLSAETEQPQSSPELIDARDRFLKRMFRHVRFVGPPPPESEYLLPHVAIARRTQQDGQLIPSPGDVVSPDEVIPQTELTPWRFSQGGFGRTARQVQRESVGLRGPKSPSYPQVLLRRAMKADVEYLRSAQALRQDDAGNVEQDHGWAVEDVPDDDDKDKKYHAGMGIPFSSGEGPGFF